MSRDNRWQLVVFSLAVVAVLVFPVAYRISAHWTEPVTVTMAERVCDSATDEGQKCRYLIFTNDGTYENTDSLLFGKFSSSDFQGAIKVGSVYRFYVAGWRVPFFSAYPNVIDIDGLPQ